MRTDLNMAGDSITRPERALPLFGRSGTILATRRNGDRRVVRFSIAAN
jgi:hypothetical protein